MTTGEVRNHHACAGTAQPLGGPEVGVLPATLPHWQVRDGRLCRTVAFRSFAEAVDFVVAIAALAERRNHHPRFCVDKRSVTLSLWTRKMSCLTDLDVELAHDLDRLAEAHGR
jgi:4a-hydroxytetrahydrobiopterin dehydratase